MKSIACQQCGGVMKAASVNAGSGWVLRTLVQLVLLGVAVVLCLSGIGALIGIPLGLYALFSGGAKKSRVWRCVDCRSIVPRG